MREVAKIRFLSAMAASKLDRIYRINRPRSPPAILRSELQAPNSSLQVLLRPTADPLERLLDVLDRVGDAETQIAFAEIAERGPGQRGDAGVVEQRVGQFLRWPSGFR